MIKSIRKSQNNNGEIICEDIEISTEEWHSYLIMPNAQQYMSTLFCFLREPFHCASYITIAKHYGESAKHHLDKINNFAKWISKSLNRFNIIESNRNICYWLIPMQKGFQNKDEFKWKLRDELVNALQIILKEKLINEYKSNLKEKGTLTDKGCKELYKWQIAAECKGKDVFTIINRIRQADFNLIDMPRSKPSLLAFIQNSPNEARKILNNLIDDKQKLDNRINKFNISIKNIWNDNWGKTIPNDERTAAAILASYDPINYPYYKWNIYDTYCKYLGIEEKKTYKCYNHFISLMKDLYSNIEKDNELTDIIYKETDQYVHSEIFCSQDVTWQMRKWMKNQINNNNQITYWFGDYTLDNKDYKDLFLSKKIWMGIGNSSINKEIESIKEGDVIMLKSTYTNDSKHKSSILKIISIGIVISKAVKENKYYSVNVEWKYNNEKEFKDFNGSYRQIIHRVIDELFINYAKGKLDMNIRTNNKKYQPYIDILKSCHNLVLTGAPGTGKTYMAKAIADEMNAEKCFVQFHPSYDYTDFVEGLRPINNEEGNIGFERKDGIFKEFCKKAIKNFIDSQKSIEKLSKELSWNEKLQQFIDDSIDNNTIYKLSNGNEFIIVEINENNIIAYNETNEKTKNINVSIHDIIELLANDVNINIVKDISNYFKRKFNTQADSYAFIIANKIKSINKSMIYIPANKVNLKPYVFIIDEINRGEVSKIFGELFYAIDPGYRGDTKTLIKTQYQNLIPETDIFAKGFYVPKNVYILATMNDIDRSVESMDFAMRRRFTWKEINPEDTIDMLNILDEILRNKAKDTMQRLNKEISNTIGLGSAYMIGPSYFLKLKYNSDFKWLWDMNIEPLLKEYLRGFRNANDILKNFRNAYFYSDKEKSNDNIITYED